MRGGEGGGGAAASGARETAAGVADPRSGDGQISKDVANGSTLINPFTSDTLPIIDAAKVPENGEVSSHAGLLAAMRKAARRGDVETFALLSRRQDPPSYS